MFPDTEWLIGNHSDELTPWIPVIAARSSYNCRFFLLPCCCYEFSGQKYQRENSAVSQYEDYLRYIYKLCVSCGFITERDRLRIPSTKRLCFVGFGRNYRKEDSERMNNEIKKILLSSGAGSIEQYENCEDNGKGKWCQEFKPRENVEPVRNCTQLDKSLIQEIVLLIAEELLSREDIVGIKVGEEEKQWNKGGRIPLGELVSVVPREKLKKLKNECGGLQTLLKNNGNIFLVQQGEVQLKIPTNNMKPQKRKSHPNLKVQQNVKALKKQKPCWFQMNHPDGCPLVEDDCSYKH